MRMLAFANARSAAPTARSRRAIVAPTSPVSRRLLLGMLVLMGIGAAVVNWPRPPLPVDAAQLAIELDGLDCGFWCPVGVDAVLHELPGLEVRSVDVATGRVEIAHDAQQVSAASIVQRLAGHWHVRRAQAIARPGRPAFELPPTAWAATAIPATSRPFPSSP